MRLSGMQSLKLRPVFLAAFVFLLTTLTMACLSKDKTGAEPRDAPIASAEVITLDTDPAQYQAHIVAEIPGSSCNQPLDPSVKRDGSTFHITVQNLFSGAEVCTADLGYRDLTIPLEGDFTSGVQYTVLINAEPPLTFVAK